MSIPSTPPERFTVRLDGTPRGGTSDPCVLSVSAWPTPATESNYFAANLNIHRGLLPENAKKGTVLFVRAVRWKAFLGVTEVLP